MPVPPSVPPPDDSPADLGRVLAEHRPRLLAVLRRRLDPALGRRLDAEDLLQEVFLTARRRWAQAPPPGAAALYSWLYRLALDCLREARRHEARGRRDVYKDLAWPEDSAVALALGLAGQAGSPSSAAGRDELHRLVRQAVDTLDDKDREILVLHYFDSLSFPEAAHVLGIPTTTARVRHLRALRRLRQAWSNLDSPGKAAP